MELHSSATYQEIISQTIAWEEATRIVRDTTPAFNSQWRSSHITHVIFTGCGSTYYLSLSAARLFQQMTGIPARGVPAGELYLYPQANIPERERTMLVAISRSGSTSETIAAVKRFQHKGHGIVVVVSNYPDSPLAQLGDHAILIPAGQEKSVAQTRSFSSMYVAITAFTVLLANRDDLFAELSTLHALGKRLIENYAELARMTGESLDIDRFYFLGSGVRYGLACEVSLKMKEMTLTNSEPFHFFEFRHGPMAMVTNTALVIGLLSESRNSYEKAVIDEMQAMGAGILTLGEKEAMVNFESRLAEEIRNVLYLPILQLLACSRSIAKGLNPDQPRNLNAVVKLDL